VSLSSIPRTLRVHVFERDGGRCLYCRLQQLGQAAVFHINHVIPRSRGGPTTADNLVVQCPYCSLHKSSRTTASDPETGAEVPLFHPLRETWQEHFALLPEGTCVGLTPTGRATLTALRMNDPIPRTARALQIMLGLI
jgi:5-methylcytosine-specific restriction endonuclease McrA